MKKINHFILPDHTNSLYDREAISSISLSKEVADKINELVDAYNRFSGDDLRWKQEQEGIIRKGVIYMKDNLLNTLHDLLAMYIADGFMDKRLGVMIEDLATRLDTLLSTVKPGSTSRDAEVIDGRIGENGEEYATLGKAIREQFKNRAFTNNGETVDASNYRVILPDVNNIDEPCFYQLNFAYGSTEIPAHLPYTVMRSNVDILATFKDRYYRQLLIGKSYLYTRWGYKNTDGSITYEDWVCLVDTSELETKMTKMFCQMGVVNAENYLEVLPDANKVLRSCTYQLNFGWNATDIPANLPYTTFRGRIDELVTFADFYYRQLLIGDKYIYTRNGILATGGGTVSYGDWVCVWSSESPNVVREYTVDKSGGGDYTSLTKCIHDNKGTKCVIHVRPGVYDLVSEGSEYFGGSFLAGTSAGNSGLPVANGTKIFMDAGAVVQFLYNGENASLVEFFSPFIMTGSGGEIHGGRIVCQNCRYAIHDDVYAASAHSRSVIDGVHIHYTSERNVCIGGGFCQSSHITVRGCTIINGNDAKGYGIFYHNAASGNGMSYLTIENNYVDGSIVIESYGTATKISTANVCGNKCTEVRKIVEGDNDNIMLYQFNNTVE